MNKKGFTLVELMAVLAVIALLAVIIFPVVTGTIKDTKKDTKKMQEASVKEAATKYVADNVGTNLFFSSTEETVTLQSLIDNGYLKGDFEDPTNGKKYNLTASKVTITKNDNSYNYKIELISE